MRVRMTVIMDVPDENVKTISEFGPNDARIVIRTATRQFIEAIPMLIEAGATIEDVR